MGSSDLLLDTHALLWALADAPQLTASGRREVCDVGRTVHASVASIWEIGIKYAIKSLDVSADAALAYCLATKFTMLPISSDHAVAASQLPLLHRDPFDRMLIAQALVGNMALMTNDAKILAYAPLLPGVRFVAI